MRRLLALVLLAGASGCAGTNFALIEPEPTAVARSALTVTPPQPWNRLPTTGNARHVEVWTLNGQLLDSIIFVGGLEDGQAWVRRQRRELRQVPVFRSAMQPQEIAELIETSYRVQTGASIFNARALKPATFAGTTGFQFDFDYLTANDVQHRGRAVGAVVDGRLYMAVLDAAATHYFNAAEPQFARLVQSARIAR